MTWSLSSFQVSMGASVAKEEEPEPGDLIEIDHLTYQHWAVSIGDGYVVHKTIPGIDSSGASSSVSGGSVSGQIMKDKLKDVVNNDSWKISNKHDNKWDPKPKEEIVEEALSMVGKDVEYSIFSSNCEHFATKCRYGNALSLQVQKAAEAAAGMGAIGILGSIASVGIARNSSVSHSQ
ncbi:phospholipase A and acyltransferase 3-like [Thunnus thynnus]|uniref:phospholipase A and acyltransferase 3-like n=1 Tax=Thunnus thynnus TaxID=8237 RepID=UPI003528324C